MELELNLIQPEGYMENKADAILTDQRNIITDTVVYEATMCMVEVNSDPADHVHELERNIVRKLLLLEDICNSHGVQPISTSELGAGRGEPRFFSRTPGYINSIGQEKYEELITIAGVHLHLSQIPDKKLDQFKVLQALDPISYLVTSTSPMNYQGNNTLNCHRLNTARNKVFREFPLHAELLEYPGSMEEIEDLNDRRWKQWREHSEKAGWKEYDLRFRPDNTGYAPIRKRDNIRPGVSTFEVRSFDSSPLDVAMAAIAIYKGVNDYLANNKVEVDIATEDFRYHFGPNKFLLPNLRTLKWMQDETIRQGLRSDYMVQYLKDVVEVARHGLPKEDLIYLNKLEEMLQTKQNTAAELMGYLRNLGYEGHQFNPDQSAQANLYMRDKHVQALHNPKYLLN
ncbi:MAG: hypothetical protein KJ896_04750 [Nanoarchaeota archaeon]|nr:hypothetical protein [Nanoarchaeota archaeon]